MNDQQFAKRIPPLFKPLRIVKSMIIDFELIKTMMAKQSEYMNYIFRLNRLELLQQQHRIALLLHSRASERYLYFRELYKSIANRIRSTEIASYIGVTKENLSRIKNQL